MAKTAAKTPAPAASLDERAADALIAAFRNSVSESIYGVTDLPKTGPTAKALALEGPDARVLIDRLAHHISEMNERQASFEDKPGRNVQGPWWKERGRAMSLLLVRLLARNHDFTEPELIALIRSASISEYYRGDYDSGLLKAIERFAGEDPPTPKLAAALRKYAEALRAAYGNKSTANAERVERILSAGAPPKSAERSINRWERLLLDRAKFSNPAPLLVDAFIAAMSLPPEDDDVGAYAFGPIQFTPTIPPKLIDALNATLSAASSKARADEKVDVRAELGAAGIPGVAVMLAAAAAMGTKPIRYDFNSRSAQRFHNGCRALLGASTGALVNARAADAASLAQICLSLSRFRLPEYTYASWSDLAQHICRLLAPHREALTDEQVFALLRFREWIARTAHNRDAIRHIDELLNIGSSPLELGEPWADRAFEDVMSLPAKQRDRWIELLRIARGATSAAPSAKWLKSADAARAELPPEQVSAFLASWLSLVGKPRPAIAGGKIPGRDSSIPSDSAADTLRGLAFLASRFDTPAMARALGDLAMACFKMVPGHGARCQKPGSSAMWSLTQMTTPSALAQLSRLRQLVKFGTAKKMLDTALDKLAARLGITTEELHEMAAPDFGLSADATITEDAGEFTIELIAEPHGAKIRVLDEDGKERKTVPESVKKEHNDTLKSLKQAKDDIDKMLEAQRARIDALFITDKVWPVPAWRERYIDHPLVGVLGRRLIWRIVDDPRSTAPGVAVLRHPDSGTFSDLDNKPIIPRDNQHIRLWHPLFASTDEVARWRTLIESASIRQPIKQAHREVYPLTPAERTTSTYSNRFAAHIIKQHAFQQLAADRGWKSKLRLMVDAEYPPPSRELPSWALRAEFWIECVGDNFGTDTTESGSYLHLATDQVRFYRAGAAQAYAHAGGGSFATHGPDVAANHPLPLDQIPPLVFSEIMRDVDLFIAGASVGNNADWQDGGPEGRFRDYWQSYSFGELGASGKARREFLEKLIPRLKIAPLCAFEGNFLLVKGTLRTYKIHLGSGNILMKPNDQYLCIVPSSSLAADNGPGGVFLPFDGDRTLSIILSKAFMLAEDTKIKDHSIVAQIKRA
jgi:hypothetical protein